MSRNFKRDRKAMVVGGGGAEKRTARVLPTILSSLLVLLLGVGLVPAFASTAQASTAGRDSGRDRPDRGSPTRIIGFVSTPSTITVGDTVRDAVSISPRAERTIEVQARKAGDQTWTITSASGRSTRAGDFTAVYQPTLGVWQYRLVVKASHHAREAVSKTRTITVNAPTTPPDVTAPLPVTSLTAVAGRRSIALAWVNPAADFTGVTIRRREGAVAPTLATGVLVTGGVATAASYTETGLFSGQQYTYAVFAHDAVLNHAVATVVTVTTSGTPRPDTTPPAPVTGLKVSVGPDGLKVIGNTYISLSWTNPTTDDFAGVMIRRTEGPTAPATHADGDLVSDFTDGADYVVDVGVFALGGLNGGTQYSYAFFAYDHVGNYAAAATVTDTTTGTPRDLTVPAPVTALTATAASATSIKLAWTNPGDTDFTGVMIRRAVGATAPHYNDGDLVKETAKADTSFTDIGLIAGGTYSYAVFAHDAVPNRAAAVTVTATLPPPPASVLPTAVLSFTSVGQVVDFDASGSAAVAPKTLSTGTLDYGDGTALAAISAASSWSAIHSYAAAGIFEVTLTVVDSAGVSATTAMTVTVSPVPTVTITGPTAPVRVNTPVVFTLATTGSAVGFWTVSADPAFDFYLSDYGTPPGTVTHTFADIGTQTVSFTFTDIAGQLAETSMVVTVVP